MIVYLLTACVNTQTMKVSLNNLQKAHSKVAYANINRIKFHTHIPNELAIGKNSSMALCRKPLKDIFKNIKCGSS